MNLVIPSLAGLIPRLELSTLGWADEGSWKMVSWECLWAPKSPHIRLNWPKIVHNLKWVLRKELQKFLGSFWKLIKVEMTLKNVKSQNIQKFLVILNLHSWTIFHCYGLVCIISRASKCMTSMLAPNVTKSKTESWRSMRRWNGNFAQNSKVPI